MGLRARIQLMQITCVDMIPYKWDPGFESRNMQTSEKIELDSSRLNPVVNFEEHNMYFKSSRESSTPEGRLLFCELWILDGKCMF